MKEDNLHPTIREFKGFMNEHPLLLEEVRKSGRTWQEYYEKWVLLGEDDPLWDDYKEAKNSSKENNKSKGKQTELFGQLMKLTENVDLDKIQKQAYQLNNTINTVQEVLGQFQETKKNIPNAREQQPFNWFRD